MLSACMDHAAALTPVAGPGPPVLEGGGVSDVVLLRVGSREVAVTAAGQSLSLLVHGNRDGMSAVQVPFWRCLSRWAQLGWPAPCHRRCDA
jgi:hypothetical protein